MITFEVTTKALDTKLNMSSVHTPIPTIPNHMKFVFGGSAGMFATCFVQPLDLIKNRMQVCVVSGPTRPSSASVLISIARNEGFKTLYNGLSAGLLRQATYTTTRLGVYTFLLEKFSNSDGRPPGFLKKAALGMGAGACGAFVGTPAEICLIRMTADGNLPTAERRNYRNAFQAIFRISRDEGVLTLWRGAFPTMGRAMVSNAAQLSSYSQAKQLILQTGYLKDENFNTYVKDGIFCHFLASMFSGLLTAIISMPFDMAKTRIQNMRTIEAKPEFKGTFDVISQVIKHEGVSSLWKGFAPYYFRLGPHTVLTFVFLEQMNGWYKSMVLGQADGKSGGL